MKKGAIAIIFLLIGLISAYGQDKPSLKFNKDGKFKIIQFTDIHFRYNTFQSDSAVAMMKQILDMEKPDLIMLTGDIICSYETKKAWDSFTKMIIDTKIPWATMLGNHDPEEDMSKKEIIDYVSAMPYCLTTNGPEEIWGEGNYVLEIKSSKPTRTAALCYIFDSGSGIRPESDLGDYEWINWTQVNWYREQSNKYTRLNGGSPLPALAFFHIPLPEYKEVVGKSTTFGHQDEKVCAPDINSGLYNAFIESRDVMGTFVGHDHNNNYIGCLRDICLAYGNVSGYLGYGSIGRGARVIELYENERKFDSWILKFYECDRDKNYWAPTNDHSRKFFVTYPDSFQESTKAE